LRDARLDRGHRFVNLGLRNAKHVAILTPRLFLAGNHGRKVATSRMIR
jgi:hypothetical protein